MSIINLFKKEKVPEYYKRLSVDELLKKFSESDCFIEADESNKEKINSEINILSEYGVKGIKLPFDVYDMVNYYGPGKIPCVEGNILKNDNLVIMVKFEKEIRNLPNVAYGIYNGKEIKFGSVDFIPKNFEIDLEGNVLEGKFRREDNKNMISLPDEYIPKEQISKLPLEGYPSTEGVSGWGIRYARYMIEQKFW